MPKDRKSQLCLENSSSSWRSKETNNYTSDENSFLTSDDSKSSTPQTSQHDDSDEENSFIVEDSLSTDGESFLSASDGSLKEYESPPPRSQPNRFAKVDLNTPRSKQALCPPSSLYKTPNRQTSSRQNLTPLAKAVDDEERALLLECYPELSEIEATTEAEHSIVEISEDESSRGLHSTSAQSSVSRSSSASDDTFERYLKLLKGTEKTDLNRSNEETSDSEEDDRFIVSDTESIHRFSDSDGEDEDKDSDEMSGNEEKEKDRTRFMINKPKPKVLESLINSFNSPSIRAKKINTDDYFLASLSTNYVGSRHPEAVKFITKGIKTKKLREELTDKLFEIFKRRCFDDQLDMTREDVTWNVKLLTTAGSCRNDMKHNSSKIELSLKVNTTPERLRDTLIHEMCHAATLLIDAQVNARHGPWWKKWTNRCVERCPSLPHIGRCHAYEIEKKFIYECNGCGQKIGRHSKSFKVEKFVCGVCKGRFVLTKNGQPLGGCSQPKMNKFALFVKENYSLYKKNGMKHNEVMKILSAKWKETAVSTTTEMNNQEVDVDISVLSIHD